LLDEYASEIRATFFRDAVDKFFPLLQEGQVYYFGNGKLKRANRRYTSVNNDYEITFDDRAVIEPAEDAGKIAQHHFEFVPIAKLADMPANSTVDVLGYVQEVQEVVSITTKAGKEVDKRDLTLVDSSSASITLTLWGEKARQPSETFTNAIIALKGCKLGDYSGRSLSTYASSTVLINEGVSASTSLESRKPISAIQDEGLGAGDRGDFITVKAHITFVSHKVERPPWYPANPDADETGRKTYKKLTDAGDGTWIDERTGKRHSEPEWRYVLNVGLGDETGTVYATCFNETAEVLLGKSATEMHAMYAASIPPGGAVEGAEIADPAWNSTFDKPLFTQWLFTLKVKVERVNDEERTRTSVVRMTPINYASECQSLHEAIAKFV
ncbi:RPA1C, partial [Symbiodinium sp. KB8]